MQQRVIMLYSSRGNNHRNHKSSTSIYLRPQKLAFQQRPRCEPRIRLTSISILRELDLRELVPRVRLVLLPSENLDGVEYRIPPPRHRRCRDETSCELE